MSEPVKVEFTNQLQGRNAANFWLGVAIIAAAVWLWWNGWFEALALEATGRADTNEGMTTGAGLVALGIETVCLVGVVGFAVFKFMKQALAAIAERLGFVTGGVYQWAAREQEKPSTREMVALRNHEQRLRITEAKTADIEVPAEQSLSQQLAELKAEVNQLKASDNAPTT